MIEIKFMTEKKCAVAYDNNIEIGECRFIEKNGTWNIIHTCVIGKYQGQGIAKRLVECINDNAIKENKKIVADCSYAKKVLNIK